MAADPPAETGRIGRVAVASFYAIARGASWPVSWWRDTDPRSWACWGVGRLAKGPLPTAGPTLGASVAAWIVLLRGWKPGPSGVAA